LHFKETHLKDYNKYQLGDTPDKKELLADGGLIFSAFWKFSNFKAMV